MTHLSGYTKPLAMNMLARTLEGEQKEELIQASKAYASKLPYWYDRSSNMYNFEFTFV